MLLARIVYRILARTFLFALGGCLLMAIMGALVGATAGAILFAHAMIIGGSGGVSSKDIFAGFGAFSLVGTVFVAGVGAISGIVSFAPAGVIGSKRRDGDVQFRRAMEWAAYSSVYGFIIRAICGSTGSWIIPASRTSINAPVMSAIVGFALGTFWGVIYSAVKLDAVLWKPKEAFRQWTARRKARVQSLPD